jgi:hypothetical protein
MLFGAALLCAVAPGRIALAAGPRHLVLVASREDPAPGVKLAEALRAQLSDLDVTLDVAWADQASPTLEGQLATYPGLSVGVDAVAVCWSSPTAAGEQIVHIADGSWQRLLARRVPAEDAGGQAAAAALIIRSAVEILLAGGTIGVAAPEAQTPPPRAPQPAASGPAPSIARIGFEIGYAFAARSAEAPAVHGIAIDAVLSPFAHLSIFAGYTVWFPVTIEGRVAELTVHRHPVHAGAAWGFAWGRISFGPRAAAVFDSTTTETSVPRGADAYVRPTRDLIVSADVALELRIRLVDRLALVLAVGADLVLNRSRYVYHGADGPEVVEEPFVAQPRAGLGLAFLSR